jgi:surface antigen
VADSRNIAEAAIRAVNSTNSGNNINWLFGTSGKTQTIIIY